MRQRRKYKGFDEGFENESGEKESGIVIGEDVDSETEKPGVE